METNNTEMLLPTLVGATPLELARAIGEVLDNKKGHEVKVGKLVTAVGLSLLSTSTG